jgi:hypothetical protein
MRLLEKIEELTLYTLQQEEHLGHLRQTLSSKDEALDDLRQGNQELAERLARLESLLR